MPRCPGSADALPAPLAVDAAFAAGSIRAAIVTAAARHIDFAADDRLDAADGGFVIELLGGKQIAVVGDGHGGHAAPRGFVDQFGNVAGAVEKTVVGVQMQMNEARGFHAALIVVRASEIFQTPQNTPYRLHAQYREQNVKNHARLRA